MTIAQCKKEPWKIAIKSDQRYKAKEATIRKLKLDLTKDVFFLNVIN
jgi:hypothetical protein